MKKTFIRLLNSNDSLQHICSESFIIVINAFVHMRKSFFAVILLAVCFVNLLSAQALLTLDVVSNDAYALNKDVYGCNNWVSTRPYYLNDNSFIKKYEDLHKPTMRYPGGTPSNYLNLITGQHETWTGSKSDDQSRVTSYNNGMSNNGKPKEDIEKYIDFLSVTGGKSTFVMNMTVMSKEEISAILNLISVRGQKLDYVEMGNELYYGQYSSIIPDAATYIALAKERAQQVKAVFPEAKIGVLLPSQIYTAESFLPGEGNSQDRQELWYEALKGEDFYDALVVHLYSTVGMGSSVTAENFIEYKVAYMYAMSHVDGKLDDTFDKLKSDFPGKNFWITEYHVGGFSGEVRNYRLRYSYLGALFTSNFLLKLFSNESVTLGSWHSMVQWLTFSGNAGGLLDSDYDFGTNVNYHFFKLFGEPVKNATQYIPSTIDGISNYNGIGDHKGVFDDVEAGVFHNHETGKGHLMLINKWTKEYKINTADLEASLSAKIVKITEVSPDKTKDLTVAMEDEQSFSLTEFTSIDSEYTIEPFSVYLIEYADNASGIEASEPLKGLQVYPNPSDGQFYIENNTDCSELKWELYSLSGQLLDSAMLQGHRTSITLEHKGPHILKLIGDNFTSYKTIIIK